uniref:Acid phosphatase n=1 Tax=Zea mays TaxID=4577 RepID=A0A804MHE8_MAIZE
MADWLQTVGCSKDKLKQKHNDRTENEVAESNDWMSPGYANAGSSPVPTPPSGKGLKASTKPKATKGQKSGPQTPLGFGSPGNPSTPVGGCRYDSSLGLLTKFLNLLKGAPGGIVDLNNAAETLELITAEIGVDDSRHGEVSDDMSILQMGRVGEKLDIDFVISTGDNFYKNGLKGVHDQAFKESFMDIYTAQSLQKPWYSVLGNHDYRGNALAQLSPVLRKIDDRFICMRSFIVNAELVDFFFIDTTPFQLEYWTHPGKHRYDWRGVAPRGKYIANLLKDMDVAMKRSTARWKIVVGHHTMRSVSEHGDTEELLELLLPVLKDNGVDFYINGHDHYLEHISSRDSDLDRPIRHKVPLSSDVCALFPDAHLLAIPVLPPLFGSKTLSGGGAVPAAWIPSPAPPVKQSFLHYAYLSHAASASLSALPLPRGPLVVAFQGPRRAQPDEAMREVRLHHALPQALRPPPSHPSRARGGQDGVVVELTVHSRRRNSEMFRIPNQKPLPPRDLFVLRSSSSSPPHERHTATAPSPATPLPFLGPRTCLDLLASHATPSLTRSCRTVDPNHCRTEEPILFLKPTSSFLHAGVATVAVEIPEPLKSLHHKVELVVVISWRGRDVPEASAMDFVRDFKIDLHKLWSCDLGFNFKHFVHYFALSKNDSYVMSASGGKISLFNMMTFKLVFKGNREPTQDNLRLPEIKGKFDPSKAAALGLRPGPKYRELQVGNSIQSDQFDEMVLNAGDDMIGVECLEEDSDGKVLFV